MNYAGASGLLVDALVAQGVQGLVVAGTGNGTLHHHLEAALMQPASQPPAPFGNAIPGKILITALSSSRA